MLNAKRAVRAMSPETRAFIEQVEALQHAPITPAERQQAIFNFTMGLPPDQRKTIEAECILCAYELQYANPAQGNRAQRREMKRRAAR